MRLLLFILASLIAVPSLAWAVPIPTQQPRFPEPLRKLPDGTMIFLHVKFARIWDAEQLRPIRDALGGDTGRLSAEVRAEIGLSLGDIETITEWMVGNPTGDPALTGETGVIITSRRPLDRRAVLKAFAADRTVLNADPLPNRVIVGPDDSRVLRFLDERTFAVMDPDFEKAHTQTTPEPIDGSERGQREAVARAIRSAMNNDDLVTVWLDVSLVKELVVPILPIFPEMKPAAPLLDARDALLTVGLNQGLEIRAEVTAPSEKAERMEAAALASLKSLVEVLDTEITQAVNPPNAEDPLTIFLYRHLLESLKKPEITRKGSSIHASIRLGVTEASLRELRAIVEKR